MASTFPRTARRVRFAVIRVLNRFCLPWRGCAPSTQRSQFMREVFAAYRSYAAKLPSGKITGRAASWLHTLQIGVA
jgi:hypothetical protein